MRIFTACLLTVFIYLSGVSQLKAGTQTPFEAQPEEPRATYVLAPQKYVGQSRSTIISKLGTPEKQAEEPIKNTHEPAVTDYIHTLSYKGLQFTTYEVRKWGEEYLLNVELDRDFPQVSQGLKIGMTIAELKKCVGPPTAEKKDALEWTLTSEEGEYAVMTVSLKNGKVAKILWTYPID